MATYKRASAWNNGGTFNNLDLLWYAKGVGAMQARAISDPASWWFFAAMHGQYLQDPKVPIYLANGWGAIPSPPAVPIPNPYQPPASTQYWDQCQHQTWFFTPWHRGYLLALEAQIRADVIKLGGPSTWALPYWDYFGDTTQYKQYNIPPAFTATTLPDGSANPLYVAARYGPDGTGTDIYVPTAEAIKNHPHNPPPAPVTQTCMCDTVFKGDETTPNFGGPDTTAMGCFSHSGQTSGDLENNPHNLVHNYVGGPNTEGLMGDPGLAALDPIFYLHHANIDRMWAGWNQVLGNSNPTDANWLNGPAACGDAVFVMPMPGPSSWVYTPKDVNSLSQLDYDYESYASLPKCPPATVQLSERLTKLGASAAAERVRAGAAVKTVGNTELVGASQEPVSVKGSSVRTSVQLNPAVRSKLSANLAAASETAPPDRVFLRLENIQGTQNAPVLAVYLNLPPGANPNDHPELLAGSVGLFGLRLASAPGGRHAGQGLSFTLDITRIVDALHLSNSLNQDSIQVTIVPHRPIPDQAPITIGRVSIYRQGN
jgi:tyrosinase